MISAAFIAFGKSCLLAKTNSKASRSSSSFNIRWSSSRASETRSRSLESTTKMIPWVFWKSGIGRKREEEVSLSMRRRRDEGREGKHEQCLQRGRILSCPPTSQTVNEMFLYSTVSTLNPRRMKKQMEKKSAQWTKFTFAAKAVHCPPALETFFFFFFWRAPRHTEKR